MDVHIGVDTNKVIRSKRTVAYSYKRWDSESLSREEESMYGDILAIFMFFHVSS